MPDQDQVDPLVSQPNSAALPPAVQDSIRALLSGAGGAISGMAQHLYQLPQRAMDASEQLRTTGEYNPAPAVETAQLLMGGGAPAAEAGAAGIFGGRLAQSADLAKLNSAKDMERMNWGPNEIHAGTGWFRGADGEWRFEIPDNKANFHSYGDTIGTTLSHPELYKNYPQIANRPITWDAPIGGGNYNPTTGGIRLNMYSDTQDQLPVTHHEIQHVIQHLEGFANGTNRDVMKQEVMKELDKLGATLPNSEMDRAAYEAYMRHAGEVEARNVQGRIPLTNYERKIIPPWSTEDRPRSNQIVSPPFPRFKEPITPLGHQILLRDQMTRALQNPPQ